MTLTRRDDNGVVLRYDPGAAPLPKPPRPSEEENTTELLALLARENRELREEVDGLRARKPDESPANPQSPYKLMWFATLGDAVKQVHLVKDVLLVNTLFVVFGESNSGKTFFVLDLALAVASGAKWRNRPTRGGLVIYVPGEGASTVRSRVAAYRKTHPDAGGLPFAILPFAVNFLDTDAVDALIATIGAAETESGEKAALVIIDTFARAVAGGDENSAKDVGVAVAAADRIRTATGACVGFVHHAGKDPAKGARGSSALRAATDTEILIEGQGGQRTATVTKQRDLAVVGAMPFELESVCIGQHEDDGTDITSCIVKHVECNASSDTAVPAKGNGSNQKKVVIALKEWIRSNPEMTHVSTLDMRALCQAQGVNRQRQYEVVSTFVANRILTPSAGGWLLHGENL